MPQVIIVSNRLPVSVKRVDDKLEFYPSLGGLATGLSSYVKDKRNLWIGWPGIASDGLNEAEKHLITTELAKHNCAPVFLTQRQLEDFYNGYSNSVLWPLFHNLRLPRTTQHEQWWKAYRHVNRLFSEAVVNLSREDSTIWVHDYQLLLVPQMLREERRDGHIGFFMHIPFPDTKTFAKLPEAKRLLEGTLGADLVGFHTTGYVTNFLEACRHYGVGTIVAEDQISLGERVIRVTAFPMGIDYQKYAAAGKSRVVKAAVKKYRRKYRGYKLIVTVDRLDPSKGLIERLKAYRELLEQNPKLRGKVVLCMVAAPSRTDIIAYQQLKKRLDALIQDINNRFGTADWQPVDYIEGLPFEEVTALFRVAKVAFIAPLQDGMNLVAKEFIASQHRDGVLVLSQTAGAAQELKDALLVDPKKPAQVVDALVEALTMPKRELRRRLKHMQKHLAANTVQNWANSFIHTLNQPVGGHARTRMMKGKVLKQMVGVYRSAGKRLLLLDYDGTLTPLVGNFRKANPSQKLVQLLQQLADDQTTDVVLISGRRKEDLDEWLGGLPIALVAEHGAFLRPNGRTDWQPTSTTTTEWKKLVLPILQTYADKTPGAMVEEKDHSLVWHYRQSPPYYAQKYAVILKRVLRPTLRTYGLKIFNGNKILEIKNPNINKGEAIRKWLDKGYDFILAIGDDYIDEDMFKVLPPDAWSIKVGLGRSLARFRVASYEGVRHVLAQLTK
jgi:trehalose 6-phosphate synthase/phosphatase